MTKRSTKNALISSVLALVLCFTSLLGTTFAWFTDSVTSDNNVIQTGTLKIAMSWAEGNTNPDEATYENAESGAIFNSTVWEPGYVEAKHIKIENKGTLALKYQLNIVTIGVVSDLTDVIDVYFVDGGAQIADRDEISSDYRIGTLTEVLNDLKAGKLGNGMLEATKSATVTIALKMQETAGNDYQSKSIGTSFAIQLLATQASVENDSFGTNDYDKDADFLPEPWTGDVATDEEMGEITDESNKTVKISTPAQLAAFAENVNSGNSYRGYTVMLTDNINLANDAWTPIGGCNTKTYFQGTFDGQGYTVYGLNVDNSTDADQHSTSGLFGWVDAAMATIKNVNLDGATVKGSHWVGGIVGYMTGTVEGCNVTNSTIIGYNVNDDANGDKVGGIVGHLNEHSYINNNSVSFSTVSGNRDIGGIAGAVATTTRGMNNNKVSDTVVNYVTDKTYASAGAIVSGRTGYVANSTNVATNVTIIKGVQVAEGVYEVGTRSYEVYSSEGLMNVNTIVANTDTKGELYVNIKLMKDVDMFGYTWAPIDNMFINFDGNGHTISNLNAVGERSGLYAYQGGGKISNLTLENVTSSGSQAGAFVGLAAGKIENCYLKGNNVINYVNYNGDNQGIGAISGVISGDGATINATIVENTTVTLNYNDFTSELSKVDDLTGYLGANGGAVVNNGTIIVNVKQTLSAPSTDKVENGNALANVINNSGSAVLTLTLGAGEYKMPSISDAKEFTIIGTEDTVIDNTLGSYMDSSKVSFEGVTIKGSTGYVYDANGNKGSDYAALYTPNVTYTNCTFDGPFRVGRDGATFINCTFKNLGNDYVWTYGNDVTFESCTFESEGKAILIYSDGGNEVSKVVVKNCVFNATQGRTAGAISNQNCAAIEIQNFGNGVDLTLSGNTVDTDNGFSGEWRIKAYHADRPAVIVNGKTYTKTALDGKLMTVTNAVASFDE